MNAWTQPGRPTRGAVALFVFVMVAFVLLAWRTEVNAYRIVMERWQSCQGGVAIVQRFNQQQQDLADIERSQTVRPDLAKRRIEVYERGVVPLPRNGCGPAPRPWWRPA